MNGDFPEIQSKPFQVLRNQHFSYISLLEQFFKKADNLGEKNIKEQMSFYLMLNSVEYDLNQRAFQLAQVYMFEIYLCKAKKHY